MILGSTELMGRKTAKGIARVIMAIKRLEDVDVLMEIIPNPNKVHSVKVLQLETVEVIFFTPSIFLEVSVL